MYTITVCSLMCLSFTWTHLTLMCGSVCAQVIRIANQIAISVRKFQIKYFPQIGQPPWCSIHQGGSSMSNKINRLASNATPNLKVFSEKGISKPMYPHMAHTISRCISHAEKACVSTWPWATEIVVASCGHDSLHWRLQPYPVCATTWLLQWEASRCI